MPRLITEAYPREIRAGNFALTLNVNPRKLAFLVSPSHGRRYFSKDRNPPGGSQDSIVRLYQLCGCQPPSLFTSLALRTPESASRDAQTLLAYGHITLEVDFQAVIDDIVVFNGDAQDLAHNLPMVHPLDHKMEASKFLSLLNTLANNKRTNAEPRQYGLYYEARLMRPLLLNDISCIYIQGPLGLDIARELCES